MRSWGLVSLGWLLAAACGADSSATTTAKTASTPSAGAGFSSTSGQAGSAALPSTLAAGSSALKQGPQRPQQQAQQLAQQAGSGAGATASAAAAGASGLGAAAGSGALLANMPRSPSTPATPRPSSCPMPPDGATALEIDALNIVNTLRLAAGAACVNLDLTIGEAATAHCAYYAMNKGSGDPMCTDNPHYEVMGCAGFTGATPVDRMHAAGFGSSGGGEVMAFLNNPAGAVQMWVDSVWHRIPILDPSTMILGYGAADGCDTIDFGPGKRGDAASVVVYPYDGQTGVTTSFDGRYEGPMPPAPVSGWPSANPISLYAQGLAVTDHQLFVDGDPTPIEHVWLDPMSPALPDDQKRMLRNVVFMYGNTPFLPDTTYRVTMTGTYAGGLLAKEWTFTTASATGRRGTP